MTVAEDDAPDTDEPDAGHLREGKQRGEKAIQAGAVSIIEAAAELFASRSIWSADPDRRRNVVAALYHVRAIKRIGSRSLNLAVRAANKAFGGDVGAWVPKNREEVAAVLERASAAVETISAAPASGQRRLGGERRAA